MLLRMNVIYSCCIAEPWVEVMEVLSLQGLKPSYVIHWRDDEDAYSKCGAFLQTVEDAWRGRGFPECDVVKNVDQDMLFSISKYELQALKMMDRLDPTGSGFSFNARQYFFRDLVFSWLGVIQFQNVSLVVSPSVPHRVFDYALYVACELSGVPFLSFQMTPFGTKSILVDDISRMPAVKNVAGSAAGLGRDIKACIDRVLMDYDTAEPEYMKVHRRNNKSLWLSLVKFFDSAARNVKESNYYKLLAPNTYWCVKSFLPGEEKGVVGWFHYIALKQYRKILIRRFRNAYLRLLQHRGFKISGAEKYILVALHYQPEETTSPSGGVFVDQLLMLDLLLSALPKEVIIVVKEHRSQFYLDQEGSSGRSLLFYRRLEALPNRVRFAPVDGNPFELIDNAYAVATVTGTIGWESAIRGTPALLFGRAWYQGMPGTFDVRSVSDLNAISPQVDCFIGLDKEERLDQIYLFHANLQASFVDAVHYKAFELRSGATVEESVQNISASVLEYVKNIKFL